MGDFLKRLHDESGLAFVFAGTAGLAALPGLDSQAASRWNGRLRLNPFDYGDAFVGLLAALDAALPMRERAGLAAPPLARALHGATGGNFRVLKNLASEAVFLAASEGAARIGRDHLARAHFQVFCSETSPFT